MPKWLKLTIFWAVFLGVPMWAGGNSTMSESVALVLAVVWWIFMLAVIAPWLDKL